MKIIFRYFSVNKFYHFIFVDFGGRALSIIHAKMQK